MEKLPVELLRLVLDWVACICQNRKNDVLPLRLVCKAFDTALRPIIFRTIQLEFSRFFEDQQQLYIGSLGKIGPLCEAIYLDMMIIREEDEIARLKEIFSPIAKKVQELYPILDSLRTYCMSDSSFDESHFRRLLETVLNSTPHMRRMKLNLPFQVVSFQGSPATMLFATTIACLANRDEEAALLETLVVDHFCDTIVNNICNNPIDLGNTISVFGGLKNLVLAIKRQDTRTSAFNKNIWFLIRKATKLKSLCLIGWNIRREDIRRSRPTVTLQQWQMRAIPYPLDVRQNFKEIRFLELRRVDIDPHELLAIIEDCSTTLKELYLIEVYLKLQGDIQPDNHSLWIGHLGHRKSSQARWIAPELRAMENLVLSVLRATRLGYDCFEAYQNQTNPEYDIKDPSGMDQPFEMRFVETAIGSRDTPQSKQLDQIIDILPPAHDNNQPVSDNTMPESASIPDFQNELMDFDGNTGHSRSRLKRRSYDAESYMRYHNTTSHYKKSIDGHFNNHNEYALRKLQKLISCADRGMSQLTSEREAQNALEVNTNTGQMAPPAVG
ncbi:hypothetical protein B0J14DRAFT_317728 [Halenospora varia]|nr:hypothetical protein B0J14DRAFT_317728 [Halenospora varia]